MDTLLGGHDLCLHYSSSLKEKVTMKSHRDRSYARWRTYAHSCMSDIYRVRVLILLCLVFGSTLFISRASSIMGWSHDRQTPRVFPRLFLHFKSTDWQPSVLSIPSFKRTLKQFSACKRYVYFCPRVTCNCSLRCETLTWLLWW